MGGKMSRDKGAYGEREVADIFHELGYVDARRKLDQYQESSGIDLENTGPFVVQVKRQKKPNIRAALQEAMQEAKEHQYPIAFTKADRDVWVVSMTEEAFCDLVKRASL